ncbi:MAG: S24 family peptidase [Alphaproteobacteria bacterium]|nr:S24 family peptidase [Alphaproteobacteria bacterium]
MPRGGYRPGAGRPKGTGAWGEATRPLRVPESLYADVQAFIEAGGCPRLPLYSSNVPAGTPGFADDHIEELIDLNALLVKHPDDTFMLLVSGDSMTGAGIFDGDLLIVDRKESPRNGRIVVANVNGQPTVKTFRQDKAGKITLMPENPAYPLISVTASDDFAVLGCVSAAIRKNL